MHLKPRDVSRARIDGFWEAFESGEKRGGQLADYTWKRKAFSLSPTSLATVRSFRTPVEALQYQKNSDKFRQEIMKKKPKHFTLQLVQFFDRKGDHLLERVYTGPNLVDFSDSVGRYYGFLKQRLKKKGIDLDDPKQFTEMNKKLGKAFKELEGLFFPLSKHGNGLDDVNTLILDYDPKTKKFLLALIDHEHPQSLRPS